MMRQVPITTFRLSTSKHAQQRLTAGPGHNKYDFGGEVRELRGHLPGHRSQRAAVFFAKPDIHWYGSGACGDGIRWPDC